MNTGEGRTPACGRSVHPDCFQRKSNQGGSQNTMTWKPLFPRHGTGTKTTRTVMELMGAAFWYKTKILKFL
jgi:hypothetical protein